MHLFEALLALHKTTGRDDVLERCCALYDLALGRFFDPSSGAIREYFSDRWLVHPAPGSGSVEPGHLFEWAWLLRGFEAATGLSQDYAVSAEGNCPGKRPPKGRRDPGFPFRPAR